MQQANSRDSRDATPAYRGYRLQALYALDRVLRHDSDGYLQPEGIEDLAIFDAENNLIEVVQVKQRSSALSLSDLEPKHRESFFNRALLQLKHGSLSKITVASFGDIGPELSGAIAGNLTNRRSVINKLTNDLDCSETEAATILDAIDLEPCDEDEIVESVSGLLSDLVTGIDADHAMDGLCWWVFTASERKKRISRGDIVERLNGIGAYLSARAAHLQEWHRSIIPLPSGELEAESVPNLQELRREFFLGTAARFEHIQAGVDVPRYSLMSKVTEGFERNRTVIVHGASGQGKSTLALRFLHDHFPSDWRFQISRVESVERAQSIALALSSHADATGIPVVLHLDVSPSDPDWTELIRRLNQHPNIQLLVTIREEDWRRSRIYNHELQFFDLELAFQEEEAREVFDSLQRMQASPVFLDFDACWSTFGREGPLLEFVYLVAQGETLRTRLTEQIARIQDDVRNGDRSESELDLIRLVSIAGAYSGSLLTLETVRHVGLSAAQRTLELLENEYLIRTTQDGQLLQGLHPIRSRILAELLTDPVLEPWNEHAPLCLELLRPEDIEIFVLHAFADNPKISDSVHRAVLTGYSPSTWSAAVGIVRGLIWKGLYDYVARNDDAIQQAIMEFGAAANFVVNFDITGIASGSATEWWTALGPLMSSDRVAKIESIRQQQSDPSAVFDDARAFLEGRSFDLEVPKTERELASAAELMFWDGWLGICQFQRDWTEIADLVDEDTDITLQSLADFTLAQYTQGVESWETWKSAARESLERRFRSESMIIRLKRNWDEKSIFAHFVLDLTSTSPINQRTSLNDSSMGIVRLMRLVWPEYEQFGCQAYGQQVTQIADLYEHDESYKNIRKEILPAPYLATLNGTFSNLITYRTRPPNWLEYCETVVEMRRSIVKTARQLTKGLSRYFRSVRPNRIVGPGGVNADLWDACRAAIDGLPPFPQVAVDRWGFTGEGVNSTPERAKISGETSNPVSALDSGLRSASLQPYEPFRAAMRQYGQSISNFLIQAPSSIALRALVGRNPHLLITEQGRQQLDRAASENGWTEDKARLATFNLASAISNLKPFQETFRALFEGLVGAKALNQLERNESVELSRLWALWSWFDLQPSLQLQDADVELHDRTLRALRTIVGGLNAALENVNARLEIEHSRFTQQIDPQDCYVTFEVQQPLDVLERALEVMSALYKRGRSQDELASRILNLKFLRIGLIPHVNGTLAADLMWLVPSFTLFSEDPEDWTAAMWAGLVREASSEALDRTSVRRPNTPEDHHGRDLFAQGIQLLSSLRHLADLTRHSEEIDDLGEELINGYLSAFGHESSPLGQSFIDGCVKVGNAFQELSESERERRPHLIRAASLVSDAGLALTERFDESNQFSMEPSELTSWVEGLSWVDATLLEAYLCLLTDSFEQSHMEGIGSKET